MKNAGKTLPYGWSKRLSVPSEARFRTLRLEGELARAAKKTLPGA